MANITNLRLQEQMFGIVEQWKQGLERKISFCKTNNFSLCKFNYWLKKYRISKNTDNFIEIKANKNKVKKERMVKFHFSGGVLAEVPSNLAIDFMNQLIVK